MIWYASKASENLQGGAKLHYPTSSVCSYKEVTGVGFTAGVGCELKCGFGTIQ